MLLFPRTLCLPLYRYVLFSIGNIKPLFQKAFPKCWKTNEICSKTWIQAIDYLEICGIIVGQILVGVLGDWQVLHIQGAIVITSDDFKGRPSVGIGPGCCNHVRWPHYAHSRLGCISKRLGNLLRLVPLFLRCWSWWRIPNDCNIRNGECSRVGKDFHKGGPITSWPQSHQRLSDAGMGSIL